MPFVPRTCIQILILPFARSNRLLSKSRFSRSNKSLLVALKLPACTTSMISFTTLFLFYSLLFSLSTILLFHSNTVLLSVQASMILILEYIHRYNTHRWLLTCHIELESFADTLQILRELSIRCRWPKPLVGPS